MGQRRRPRTLNWALSLVLCLLTKSSKNRFLIRSHSWEGLSLNGEVGGGGCGQRVTVRSSHNQEGEEAYWSSMFVVVHKPRIWTFPRQIDILFVFASVCFWAGLRQTAGRWKPVKYIKGHGRRAGHDSNLYWLSRSGRVLCLRWLYKQPGDWFSPAWSMLPQVKRVVPSALCLLFLAAPCLLFIAQVSLSCNTGSPDHVKLPTPFSSSSWVLWSVSLCFAFFSPPHPVLLPSVHLSQRLDLNMLRIHGVKINNVISTLSQFSINDFEVCLSRRIHHDSSASEGSSDTSAGQTDRQTERETGRDRYWGSNNRLHQGVIRCLTRND